MKQDIFKRIRTINFEGPRSKNPLAFKHYNPDEFVRLRYDSRNSGIGAKIESGKSNLKALESYILKKGEASPNASGRQEFLENLISEFV
jgi:xylose isomerase